MRRINPNPQSETSRLYNVTVNNFQHIGGKTFAAIDESLLKVNSAYQRTGSASKLKKLIVNWDENKMDPLMVSWHQETKEFYIINGYHRLRAGKANGKTSFECQILTLGEDPSARLIEEAKLFATQNRDVDNVKIWERHNSNVLIGVRENVSLQELLVKHGLSVVPTYKKILPKGVKRHVSGISEALAVVRWNPEIMDYILDVLDETGFCFERNGYHGNLLRALKNVFGVRVEDKDAVREILIEYLTELTPDLLFAKAATAYPMRSEAVGTSLLLESVITAKGLKQGYTGEKVKFTAAA